MSHPAPRVGRFGAPDAEAIVDVGLLGPLTVSRNGLRLDLTGPKRRALLILLALHAGTPVHRDRIIEALWPERPSGREESTLRVHVSHLRDVLEPSRDGEPSVLVTSGSGYMLSPEGVRLDMVRFAGLAREGRSLLESAPSRALDLLNQALGLWRGRPLQDVEYEEFAQDEIRRLEMARIETLEDRAEALVELGEDAAAVEDLQAMVRTDPTRERPVLLLMKALYRTGRHAESLRVARRHGRRLAEQGLEPSPRVGVLEERILQHDPTLLPEGSVSPADIRPGRSVRGYELRAVAGAGTMGVVYRAFQASVGREVAVKVIHPGLAETPSFVRRFVEEARVVAGLEHPHIVPLHDFWREPVGAFLVMRWMDGGSLADRLGARWEGEDLVRVFGQLADALGYAHSASVVHRDVKPANVLFDGSGNAYLCDFGLAVLGRGQGRDGGSTTLQPPYASPELTIGEPPSASSDVFGLGVLLAEAASGEAFTGDDTPVEGGIREVVMVATAPNPADRYPDMAAFRSALMDAVGPVTTPAPRRVRRNPYKGLEPFGEGDRADFYGRDDVVESLLDVVRAHGLTAVIGASGSGKSSVVKAGLVPELRDGAIPGSDEWAIVSMLPGVDPFDEFHIGLRDAAVGRASGAAFERSRELRQAFDAALDGPNSRALLIVDQFEEVFSSEIDEETRQRFLDNLADLASDPAHRIRVLLTLRADFSDRPLAHPRFGDLMARASVLVAPMRPEQVEEVIRNPAARVGVQVEPGLIAEVVRDVATSSAYLPLLQYVLSELFERRSEDRLTVQAYRALGGVQGVLERRAEATFTGLGTGAQRACRQLFLRMVHLGERGEETRRRLPLTELAGLGGRGEVDEALEAFGAVRLLTYDRDPVTRTPTVEVAHETVIRRWTRYRIWVDEARADLLAHRRLTAAAATWAGSGEDSSYLLTGGPLAAAVEVASGGRVGLNQLEARFVTESHAAEEAAREHEAERRHQQEALQHRARRRLRLGVGTGVVAVLFAAVAGFAWIERQRADDLAEAQGRQNLARELAAASVANLTSADPHLSLLLAIEAAASSVDAGEEILPEVVDALHRAVISPRPSLEIEGARYGGTGHRMLDWSDDGRRLAFLAADGGVTVVDSVTGETSAALPAVSPPAFGLDFHPDGDRILTMHADGVREWELASQAITHEIAGSAVTTAGYSRDGAMVAIGQADGIIRVHRPTVPDQVSLLEGHTASVRSVDFDPTGTRLVSGALDGRTVVWDIVSESIRAEGAPTVFIGVAQAIWHPSQPVVAVTMIEGQQFTFDADTGRTLATFASANQAHSTLAFGRAGFLLAGAGSDGAARLWGAAVGGAHVIELPNGGVPLRYVGFDPSDPRSGTVATVGLDGRVRVWRDVLARSELPIVHSTMLYPHLSATPDGSRYVFGSYFHILGVQAGGPPSISVVEAATGRVLTSRVPVVDPGVSRRPAISDDGSSIAYAGPTGDPAGDIEVVDVDTGDAVVIPGSARWTMSLAFSSDGALLAGGDAFGSIGVWDTSDWSQVAVLTAVPEVEISEGQGLFALFGPDRILEVEFRPGTHEFVAAGTDGTVRAWDPESGDSRLLHEFGFGAFSVDYTADGAVLAVADNTGTLRVLDADTGGVVATPERVPGQTWLDFSPDGRWLAGGGPGVVTHLWDMETGRIVRRFQGAIAGPKATFVNGGSELRIVSGEGNVRGYVLDPLDLLEIARHEVGRELTEDECLRYLRRSCED